MEEEALTIDVSGEGIYRHLVGDTGCAEGWCDGGSSSGYPKPCECGGLIHADFGDENYDCDYWLWTKCDQCGESE
jgi:hypothetical protein